MSRQTEIGLANRVSLATLATLGLGDKAKLRDIGDRRIDNRAPLRAKN
jgi:hypothetical protein